MSDVTQIWGQIENGDGQTAEQVVPLPAFQVLGVFLRHDCHRPDGLRLASGRIESPGSSTVNVLGAGGSKSTALQREICENLDFCRLLFSRFGGLVIEA